MFSEARIWKIWSRPSCDKIYVILKIFVKLVNDHQVGAGVINIHHHPPWSRLQTSYHQLFVGGQLSGGLLDPL